MNVKSVKARVAKRGANPLSRAHTSQLQETMFEKMGICCHLLPRESEFSWKAGYGYTSATTPMYQPLTKDDEVWMLLLATPKSPGPTPLRLSVSCHSSQVLTSFLSLHVNAEVHLVFF